uniref:SPOR domain-containing protein n=1 Tax=uncultured Draconibacterium sp. TaxID=1573823 RepID=UPI0032166AB0
MDLKKTNAHLTIFLALLFASIVSYAGMQKNQLVKAILLFDAEKYTEAEQVLKQLVQEKPDDLMINYYYGACRTENKHFGIEEINALLKGSSGEAPLKTNYYLGVQYHAQNQWEEALKYYTRYKSKTKPEEQNRVYLSEKIQQCYNKTNPFVSETAETEIPEEDILPTPVPREEEIEEYRSVLSQDSVTDTIINIDQTDSLALKNTDSVKTEKTVVPHIPTKVAPKPEPINFEINGEITYIDTTNFKTKDGLKFYLQGKQKQNELNKRLKDVDTLRKKYASTTSYNEKQTIGEQILAAENGNYTLQTETQQLLARAKQAEIDFWDSVSYNEKQTLLKELDDYSKSLQQNIVVDEPGIDTSVLINPEIILVTPDITTAIEESTEDELVYKIQLGAYSRGLPSYVKNLFKKLSYIRKIENYTDEKGIVVYTTGNLTNYEDALKMQNQVRREGVEDAFVVPYFNGKRITLKEAKEIEAER